VDRPLDGGGRPGVGRGHGRTLADRRGREVDGARPVGRLLVGRGGFTRIRHDDEWALELGWAVRDARAGRGYATELGRAALRWGAEHEPHLPVIAFTEVHNHASRAVMERLRMRPAGLIRRTGLIEGKVGLHPDAPFALYRI